MEEADYQTTYELEGDNWWFVGTRRICLDLLDDLLTPGADPRILDVGCGTGIFLDSLGGRGRAVGADLSATAIGFCRERGSGPFLQADAVHLPVGDASLDALTAIGVVEHLDDDAAAVAEWRRVLRPGGALVLLTSAYQWMWSGHDVSNHHTRRYRGSEVRRLLEAGGFEPVKVSYVNTLLFPPIAAVRLAEIARRRGRPPGAHKDTGEVPGPVNRGLLGLLEVERRLLRRTALPFGVSIVASARAR